jgi:hypothetical protein
VKKIISFLTLMILAGLKIQAGDSISAESFVSARLRVSGVQQSGEYKFSARPHEPAAHDQLAHNKFTGHEQSARATTAARTDRRAMIS